jgi:hypothetical protein
MVKVGAEGVGAEAVSPPGGLAGATGINPTNSTTGSLGLLPSILLPRETQESPIDGDNEGEVGHQKNLKNKIK